MDKSQSEKPLSADQKLEIREEVERRFTHMPAETLKMIQAEVASRVSETERFYLYLGGLLALFVVIATGVTWNNLRQKTNEVIRRTGDVELLHSNVLERYGEITNMYAAASERYTELTNRIHELEGMDNIVTTKQLQKSLEVVNSLTSEASDALFTASVLAADAGDATAYDRLASWAEDHSNPLWLKAQTSINNLQASLRGPFNAPIHSDVGTTWNLGLGFESARGIYLSSLPEARLSVIETIAGATNFTKGDRMSFLVGVAETDSTIMGRRLAVELINKESNQKFDVRRPDEIFDWWRTNKSRFTSPK
jgi:hypothetical protein